jgi:hypothetical protein
MTETELADRPPGVFISHSHEDASAAALIARSLSRYFTVYSVEPEVRLAQNWSAAIAEPIGSIDIVVVLFSKAALSGRWVGARTAAALATDAKRREIDVVPVLLEPCDLPEGLRDWLPVDLSEDGALGVGRLIARLRGERAINFKTLDAVAFERLVGDVLEREGYSVTARSGGRDMAYDLIATRGSEQWVVEVKHYSHGKRVSVSVIHQVAELLRRLDLEASALLVTSTQLTSVAQEYLADTAGQSQASITVIDGVALKQLIAKHPDLIETYFVSGQSRRG